MASIADAYIYGFAAASGKDRHQTGARAGRHRRTSRASRRCEHSLSYRNECVKLAGSPERPLWRIVADRLQTPGLRMLVHRAVSEAGIWLDWLLAAVPGSVGIRMRRIWMRRRVGKLGIVSVWGNRVRVLGGQRMQVGDFFSIDENGLLSAEEGQLVVGSRASINRNVVLDASYGAIHIGDDVLIGSNVVIRASDHNFESTRIPINRQGHVGGRIIIQDDVWIAANVVVTGGVTIGAHSVVAAGAVVTKDVEPSSIAAGVPAKTIRRR